MILTLILLYIIPLVLCVLFDYLCMRKGESIEEYVYRADLDGFDIIMYFTPIANIIYGLMAIVLIANEYIIASLWHKIKKFRK